MKRFLFCLAATVIALNSVTGTSRAEIVNYHVGRDSLPTLVAGSYSGLVNPNHQRLTLLRFNDLEVSDPAVSHWHSIGTFSYSGPAASPTVLSTNGNNRIPEIFTGFAPLNLSPGHGAFDGKLVSGVADGSPQSLNHYDRLEMRSVQDLLSGAPGSVENFLYNSSSSRWNQPLGEGTQIVLELLGLTPGLHLSDLQAVSTLANVGESMLVGQGDDWSFEPVFWVDGSAGAGTYSAQFRLIDTSGTHLPSGTINFDFAVVPEPSAVVLGALGVATLAVVRRQRA